MVAHIVSPEEKLVGILKSISYVYEEEVLSGLPQEIAFDSCVNVMVEMLGITERQAANLARVVVAFVGARNGQTVYSSAELE